jgi:8-oxo-dGTP pyrophosphatase MutT (NUDIX family)
LDLFRFADRPMKQPTTGTIRQAGGVVVRRKGRGVRVLLIRSSDGTRWLFPKGHIEAGESARQTAAREVREEAGVVGEVKQFLGRQRFKRGSRTVEVSYYLVSYEGDAAASEDREMRWCRPADAARLLSFEELKSVLRRALSM